MGLFDWLHASSKEPETPSGMSRRAFFARVAGQADATPAGQSGGEPATQSRPDLLCAFYVARFPYHDGPVLVPILRTGIEFMLVPDPFHAADPDAVKIVWGKDHLGYVPAEHSAEIRRRLEARERLHCRSASVDPGADLSRVLWVEITRDLPPPEEEEDQSGSAGEADAAEGEEAGRPAS